MEIPLALFACGISEVLEEDAESLEMEGSEEPCLMCNTRVSVITLLLS